MFEQIKEKLGVKSLVLLMIVGAVLMGSGFVLGAETGVEWHNGRFHAIGDPSRIYTIDIDQELAPFTSLAIAVVGNIEIVEGDGFHLSAYGESWQEIDYRIDHNGRLFLDNTPGVTGNFSTVTFGFNTTRAWRDLRLDIKLTIPYGTVLTHTAIDQFGRELVVSGLTTDTLALDSFGGNARLNDVVVLEHAALSNFGGNTFVEADLRGFVEASTFGGNIHLTLPYRIGYYSFSMERFGGNINGLRDMGPRYPNPIAHVDVSTFGGNINLNFAN